MGLEALGDCFLTAEPFPHLILDDVFGHEILCEAFAEIPFSSPSFWTHWGAGGSESCALVNSKRGISSLLLLGEKTSLILKLLNSDKFLEDIKKISGIDDLTVDHTFNGGGLHCTGRGGRLRVHADRVRHPQPKKFDQAVNLILYINPGWLGEFGGNLEFWACDATEQMVSIAPLFNRLVIFKSDRTTFHGQPEPTKCPEGMYRTSLAVYYYVPRVSPFEAMDNDIDFRH